MSEMTSEDIVRMRKAVSENARTGRVDAVMYAFDSIVAEIEEWRGRAEQLLAPQNISPEAMAYGRDVAVGAGVLPALDARLLELPSSPLETALDGL